MVAPASAPVKNKLTGSNAEVTQYRQGRRCYLTGRDAGATVKTAMEIYKRFLPHWRMKGATYFVTWRVKGDQNPLQPEERSLIVSTINHFDGVRFTIHAYVVMDDHVHVLFTPLDNWKVEKIVHTWKSFTANRLQRSFSRSGKIWQREYFDRIARDESEFLEKGDYILGNPFKRWSDIGFYQWADVGKTYK